MICLTSLLLLFFLKLYSSNVLASVATANSYIVFMDTKHVTSNSSYPSSAISSIQARSTSRTIAANNGGHVAPQIYSIGNFSWYVDTMYASDAEMLAQDEAVLHMHKDDPVFYLTELVQENVPSWGLDRIDQRVGRDTEYHFPSSAGEGVDVYLIDTGVNVDHVDFEGRATHGPAFISGRNQDPIDRNGHGSFVAGVCCGKEYGVAKRANVISLKALDQGGSGKLSNILQALHWIVKRHLANPGAKSIVNLSLAAEFHLPTNQAIEQAIKLGIHFSIAAGNQGKEACQFSPASVKNALVVGAIDQNDSAAPYSNFGSCVDIYAPGTAIKSVWYKHDKDVHVLSGTSMAAPHVTGVMANLLSQDNYTPLELIEKVKQTATLATGLRTVNTGVTDDSTQLVDTELRSSSVIRVLYINSSTENFIRTDIVPSFSSSGSTALLGRLHLPHFLLLVGIALHTIILL